MVEVLGWACAVVGSVIALPQVVRILRARTSAGVSLLGWQLMLVANLAWTGHGLLTARFNVFLPNVLLSLGEFAVVVLVMRDRSLIWWRVIVWPLVLSLLLVGVDTFIGPFAYAMLILVPQLIATYGQLHEVMFSISLEGLSGGFLFANLLVNSMWAVWATLAPDHAIQIVASTMVVVTLTVFVWYLLRRFSVISYLGRGTVKA